MKTAALPRLALPCVLLLAACAGRETKPETAGPAAVDTVPTAPAEPVARVAEAFVTASSPDDEIDSVAAWAAPGGETWLIATAKASNSIVVYDGDSGRRLRHFGREGEGPGQFRRPNGIAVFADLLFVVERDNKRVQILRLPDLAPLGSFGQEQLLNPYGLWLTEVSPNDLELLVTDSFMADFRTEKLPPMDELDGRVKRYRINLDGERPVARFVAQFGDTTEAGALRMVESIAGDPAHDRLLIAEEDIRVGTTLREYTFKAGTYTGRNLPPERFQAQAEGVALWACPDGSGYWLTVDQSNERSIFHVFDRDDLEFRGSFSGNTVAVTDGIVLHPASTRRFPYGVFYAAHDDQGVGAFDWRDIARALELRLDCSTSDTPRS